MEKRKLHLEIDELYKKVNANQNCKLKTNISMGTMSNKLSSSLRINFKNRKIDAHY